MIINKENYSFYRNVISTNIDQVSVLTYLWMSPSIAPKLTLKVAWCFSEERWGGLCCGPVEGSVSGVVDDLTARTLCKVCCFEEDREETGLSCIPVSVSWLDVGPVTFCGRSFFRRQDNWGLRRRTRVPPIQRTLFKQTREFIHIFYFFKLQLYIYNDLFFFNLPF